MKLVVGLFVLVSLTNSVGSEPYLVSREATASPGCPIDLSSLRPKMEATLASVSSPTFKEVILASLSASIPNAIQRADGINTQIAYLQSEIAEQDRLMIYSEKVARDATGNFMEPLKPCPSKEKGSYCTAVEQYYISLASNLANRAFLEALKCYKRQGVR